MVAARALSTANDEVVVPLQVGPNGQVDPVTMVRSTLISASVQALKSGGAFERYLEKLPPFYHKPILEAVAGTWLDLPIGVAHYQAANAAGLSTEEVLQIGRGISARTQESLLGPLVRAAKAAGVTPWTALEHIPKLLAKFFIGGSVTVYKTGPKDARYELHGLGQIAELAYFRHSHRGMLTGTAELFCKKMYIQDASASARKGVILFRLSWA